MRSKYPATYAIGLSFSKLSPTSFSLKSVDLISSLSGLVVAGIKAGTLESAFEICASRLSKSSSQFPRDEFKNELKNSFVKACVNWMGVGLSLFPHCCRIVPKKFCWGSVKPSGQQKFESVVLLKVIPDLTNGIYGNQPTIDAFYSASDIFISLNNL